MKSALSLCAIETFAKKLHYHELAMAAVAAEQKELPDGSPSISDLQVLLDDIKTGKWDTDLDAAEGTLSPKLESAIRNCLPIESSEQIDFASHE